PESRVASTSARREGRTGGEGWRRLVGATAFLWPDGLRHSWWSLGPGRSPAVLHLPCSSPGQGFPRGSARHSARWAAPGPGAGGPTSPGRTPRLLGVHLT